MLCQQNDLADMIGVMGQLAVDRLNDSMSLAPYRYGAREIARPEPFDIVKKRLPARFPELHQAVSGVTDQFELRVAVAVGLFAIRGQKVAPAGMQVTGNMFDNDRYGICLRVDQGKEMFIVELRDGPLGKLFVAAKGLEGVSVIVRNNFLQHGLTNFHAL